jgi:formamidopyrimidine-DNA glycosylase
VPELPEVETIRRDLVRRLRGSTVIGLWTSGLPLRLGRPIDLPELQAASVGHRFVSADRVGKHLILRTSGGRIVVHLGMSGRLQVVTAGLARAAHTHVVWRLADGRELRYVDPRRFGMVAAGAAPTSSGIEPLSSALDDTRLADLLAATRRPVKAFLLDQTKIAGLGNIYVCEALFRARIHPATRSDRVTGARVRALRGAIVSVLRQGIANRGTTLRDYTDGRGEKGRNQHVLLVYGREGEPCANCGAAVRRRIDQGRSTFFCARCQRR